MAVMGLHIWNLYHRGSQNRNSHEAGRMPKRPNNVNKTVPPNQYLVKNGRLLNQSWMSPPSGIFITFFLLFHLYIYSEITKQGYYENQSIIHLLLEGRWNLKNVFRNHSFQIWQMTKDISQKYSWLNNKMKNGQFLAAFIVHLTT